METLTKIQRDILSTKQAIVHWQEISSRIHPDMEEPPVVCATQCPLCKEYNTVIRHTLDPIEERRELSCVGCPIFEKTGIKFCTGTPYEDFDTTCDLFLDTDQCYWETLDKIAHDEIDFLKAIAQELEAKNAQG